MGMTSSIGDSCASLSHLFLITVEDITRANSQLQLVVTVDDEEIPRNQQSPKLSFEKQFSVIT